MKKRILAAVMALVLAVTMYSGIRLSSVNANADENDKDITLSVTTDKTDVRPGDEVTVTVNIEKFTPTTNNSDNPFISMWQVFVPVDTSVFEFVGFDEDSTTLIDDGFNFDSAVDMAKAVMSYNVNKKNRPNIYYLDTDKNGENSTSVVYKFKLRVKSDISDNKSVSFDLSDSSIFKQFNTPAKFTYTTMPTTVNVIAKELSSIEVSKNPDKINYFTGSNDIDITGGKVKLVYSNGTSEEIDMTSDMCSKVDLSTAGTKTVTVTYQGKTTTFEVVVADKKAVSMTLNGVDGKSIIEGTKLDVAGMSADITYDDGSVENVALTDDMVSYDNSKVGQSAATVKVAGLTKTFTFDVVAKTLEKIEVTTQPDKTRFFLNKTVDFSGAKITVSYNNGTTEVVDVTSDMCSSVDTSTLGEKTVTVTYQGKTATFKVYVVDKTAQSLELNGVTGKSVTEGMKLDVTGMTAVIRYDDGSSKTVNITEDMLTYSTDKTGQAIVRVSVEGLTKEFTINVVAKKAVSVKLSGTDNKSVVEGMKLDLAGINAEVTYDNGTKETVSYADENKINLSVVTDKSEYTSGDVVNVDIRITNYNETFSGTVTTMIIELSYDNDVLDIDMSSIKKIADDNGGMGFDHVSVNDGKVVYQYINVSDPLKKGSEDIFSLGFKVKNSIDNSEQLRSALNVSNAVLQNGQKAISERYKVDISYSVNDTVKNIVNDDSIGEKVYNESGDLLTEDVENQTKQNVNDNNVTSDNKSVDNVSVNKDNAQDAATYSQQSSDTNESNNEAKQGNVLLIAIIGITVIVVCIAYVLIRTRKKKHKDE